MDRPIEAVAIIGSGFMGGQIGLHCAVQGHPVRMYDVAPEGLARAAESQTAELDGRVARGEMSVAERDAALKRVWYTSDLAGALAGADLVIEAVPERLDAKRAIFAEMDRLAPPEVILATNSSSLRIASIEDVTVHPERVMNLHFYAVPWQRRIVELMRGTATTDEAIARATAFVRSLGLAPLIVRRDSKGFIYNRVWRAIKKECLRVVDSGVASAADVDRAWLACWGGEMGPFGLMDLVGMDVVRDIELEYYRESGDPDDLPPKVLLDMIARGELGVKTGRGFYTYPDPAFERPDFMLGEAD
jgi:3-hydroxybutyryl-CoA dehydrogenase